MEHRRFCDEGHYVAFNIDEFGTVGLDAFKRMETARTKRERKTYFRQLVQLFKLAHTPASSYTEVVDIALGSDKNGVLCLYFITDGRDYE